MRLFETLICASLALAAALCTPTRAAETRVLTVLTWGGAYEKAQRAAIFDPFTAATGIEIETVRYTGGIGMLKGHLAQDGAPRWDVADMIRADARAACAAGLLAPFDPDILAPAPDGTPARDDFLPGSFGPCFVSQIAFATVIAYDDRAFPGEKPSTIADFFDLERFPGKRALRRAPAGLLEWALRAYGVPRAQIYDLLSTERGLRLAFKKLDLIRPELVWWRDGQAPVELLEAGKVAMASGYNGRFFDAQTVRNLPVSVIWDSAFLQHEVWATLKGTPDRALADKFIRFATASERLGALANRISYGPLRKSAQARVGLHVDTGTPMRPHLPTTPRHARDAIRKDDAWYARTESLRRRRFEAWLADGKDAQAAVK